VCAWMKKKIGIAERGEEEYKKEIVTPY